MDDAFLVDFDDGLPPQVQEALLRSPVCQAYRKERRRLGQVAMDIVEAGGSLNDSRLQAELAAFQPLLSAVAQERERFKRAFFE